MTADKSPGSVACMNPQHWTPHWTDQEHRPNHSECVPSTTRDLRWFITGEPCQRPDFHEETPMIKSDDSEPTLAATFPEVTPKLSWAEYVALREADPEVLALREAVRRGALSGPFTESTEGM